VGLAWKAVRKSSPSAGRVNQEVRIFKAKDLGNELLNDHTIYTIPSSGATCYMIYDEHVYGDVGELFGHVVHGQAPVCVCVIIIQPHTTYIVL
jgi:hypothetical protein